MWTYKFYHGYFGWLTVDREWSTREEVEAYVSSSPYKTRIIRAS